MIGANTSFDVPERGKLQAFPKYRMNLPGRFMTSGSIHRDQTEIVWRTNPSVQHVI